VTRFDVRASAAEVAEAAADRFVAVVADEVERLRIGGRIEWEHFETLFDRVALRVIFGDRARDDQELTALLEELMAEANRIAGTSEGDTDELYELHGRMEWHLREPEPGSLVARFAEAPQTDRTRVVHQIPHWIFATRDTLAMNVCRALAAILAHEEVEERAREEIEGADLTDASAIGGMRYLEGCLAEAMRLWPTTPILAREAVRDTEILGEKIEEGTQVMMLNAFNHRDTGQVPDADEFNPRRWESGEADYRFNHLSNGTQNCPGGPLVYLLGKAVLAHVLDEYELKLAEPELPESGAMPAMLDFFCIRFDAEVRR
jgi:cytochrome P450